MPPKISDSDLSFTEHRDPRRRTDHIVVHHTAGSEAQRVEDVHTGHKSKGWIGVGYNLLQTADSIWHEGRGLDNVGAHAKGHNETSIGLALTGNFEDNPLPSFRYQSLLEMCVWLCKRFRLPSSAVKGHRELPGAATLCPGTYVNMHALRYDVAVRLGEVEPPRPASEPMLIDPIVPRESVTVRPPVEYDPSDESVYGLPYGDPRPPIIRPLALLARLLRSLLRRL